MVFKSIVEFVKFMIPIMLLFGTAPSFSSSSFSYSYGDTGSTTNKDIGFTVELIHTIYSPQSPFYNPRYTHADRLQASIDQSYSRYHHHQKKLKSTMSSFNKEGSSNPIEAPVRPIHDQYGSGYLVSFEIGTPPTQTLAHIDTGSSLTWLQCSPCDSCFKQETPLYNPSKSSSYAKLKCDDPHIKTCASSMRPYITQCKDYSCSYDVHYWDRSYSEGDLATETLSFGSDVQPLVSIPNIAFGCGHNNSFTSIYKPPGMFGLDRSELSFISQLGNSKFSYCLLPLGKTPERETSKIRFGSLALFVGRKTALITNPKIPGEYYVNFEGIGVGNKRLSFPKGTFKITPEGYGGFFIDSGTTFTFINSNAFDIMLDAIKKNSPLTEDKQYHTVYQLCYWCTWNDILNKTPNVTFHFAGVDLELTAENTWVLVKSGWFGKSLWCLAMHPTDYDEAASLLGSHQQRNFNVGYDLENNVISFKPVDCTRT